MKNWAVMFLAFVIAQPAWAGDPMVKLSKQLSKGAATLSNRTVAILAFPYHDGRVSSGSSILSERLTTDMVGMKNIKVVERRLIKKILQEKNLSETGLLDQENAKTIGTILGVDAIVTGTLIDMENGKTEINARMINAGSGEILSAATASVERNWSDSPVMPEKPIVKKEESAAPVIAVEPASTPAPPAKKISSKLKLSNENFPPGHRKYHKPGEPEMPVEYDESYEPEMAQNSPDPTRKKPELRADKGPERSPYDPSASLTDRRVGQFKTEKMHRSNGSNDTPPR